MEEKMPVVLASFPYLIWLVCTGMINDFGTISRRRQPGENSHEAFE